MESELQDFLGTGGGKGDEKRPLLFGNIHGIPKQIADSCVSVGGNLKFIESGMPAPVLKPSQEAHDRILSAFDAFVDSVVIVSSITAVSLFYAETFNAILMIIISLYWGFHIAWWQKTVEWRKVGALKRYFGMTYKVYHGVLIVSFLVLMSGTVVTLNKHNLIENPIQERIKNNEIGAKVLSFFKKSNGIVNANQKDNEGVFSRERRRITKTENKKTEEELKTNNFEEKFYYRFFGISLLFVLYTIFLGYFYYRSSDRMSTKIEEEAKKDMQDSLKNKQQELRDLLE